MLAITENQIAAQGLEWAFCDTDSMAIAMPDGMAGDEFGLRVQAITDWFAALNPYAFAGSILKIEAENASLETGKPEPLFCWAVSSKRYALFNLASDGRPILRKVSAHGLGHLRPPYSADNPPADILAPPDEVMRSGVERWHCDLWFEIVSAGLGQKPDMPWLDFHPAMNSPAISRYGATAPDLLDWFDNFNTGKPYCDQVKPFGFLLSLTARRHWAAKEILSPQSRQGRPPKVESAKPVAPFDTDLAMIVEAAFDRESGKPVPAHALQSYREAIAQYHLQPEAKFLGGNYCDRGTTQRRHIRASDVRHIGKEANELERQATIGADSELDPDYGLANDSRGQIRERLAKLVAMSSNADAAMAIRIPSRRLRSILNGKTGMDESTARTLLARLPAALEQAENLCAERALELRSLGEMVHTLGLRESARRLGLDPSNLRRRLRSHSVKAME